MNKTLKVALGSLLFNMAFSAYNLTLGALSRSWWLLTLGSYYLILSIVRFFALTVKKNQTLVRRFTGIMLMLLSVPLVGTVILSVVRDRGHRFHTIVMIAMAAYAFTKITFATLNFVKTRGIVSATLVTLRNISFADAFVSIFALQRSMLVSFEGMTEGEIRIMNAVIGSAVCAIVFWLGFDLLRKRKNLSEDVND